MNRSPPGMPLAKIFCPLMRQPPSTGSAVPDGVSQSEAPLPTSWRRSLTTRRSKPSTGFGSRRHRQLAVATICVCIDSVSAVEPQ